MGYKGAWSGILGLGALITFWLISIIGSAGVYIGILIVIILFCISDKIYNETPERIEKIRTQQEKYKMTSGCKTADEVHDVLFCDKVERAARGFARKKGLKSPNGDCYSLAIRSYTQAFIHRSQSCFPEALKNTDCFLVYYKPIIRITDICGIKRPNNIGKIFSLGVGSKGLYKLNIPNEINYFSIRKYGLWDLYNEAKTTKISDERWTIESQRS